VRSIIQGAYPKGFIKSQEELDWFWNTRIGICFSFLASIIVFAELKPIEPAEYAGLTIAVVCFVVVFHATFVFNIGGRIMTYFIGPFNPDDY
jgi:hypothetical protein